MNSTINQEGTFNPSWYDSLHFSYPLNEQANYYQTTIQLETELPFGITFIGQFFKYDTLSYAADTLPVSQQISIPNLNFDPEDMTPANFFTPGMGAPLAILSKNIGLIILEKTFLNEQAKLNAFIAKIPLVGNILVGKKTGEGVVGVSFKMKGPPKDIKTTVNPIKTLTPRFIVRALEKMKKKKK